MRSSSIKRYQLLSSNKSYASRSSQLPTHLLHLSQDTRLPLHRNSIHAHQECLAQYTLPILSSFQISYYLCIPYIHPQDPLFFLLHHNPYMLIPHVNTFLALTSSSFIYDLIPYKEYTFKHQPLQPHYNLHTPSFFKCSTSYFFPCKYPPKKHLLPSLKPYISSTDYSFIFLLRKSERICPFLLLELLPNPSIIFLLIHICHTLLAFQDLTIHYLPFIVL